MSSVTRGLICTMSGHYTLFWRNNSIIFSEDHHLILQLESFFGSHYFLFKDTEHTTKIKDGRDEKRKISKEYPGLFVFT